MIPPIKIAKTSQCITWFFYGGSMKKVKLYTINNCPYCDAAKSLLKSKNFDVTEFNLTGDEEGKIALLKKTAHRTFPQIFIDDVFIGGYTELKAYL